MIINHVKLKVRKNKVIFILLFNIVKNIIIPNYSDYINASSK